jgi:hypothetical protein
MEEKGVVADPAGAPVAVADAVTAPVESFFFSSPA